MSGEWLLKFAYAAPLLFIFAWYFRSKRRRETSFQAVLAENEEAGLMQPASLHPLIDHTLCIGCGACVAACPEQDSHTVLGLVRGKAHLVSPTDCIGHGACKTACPVTAISLVFGTETRGVDIPMVKPNFETNVPGVFIAGELGGMGLIRNAIEQGRQAMESIQERNAHLKKSNARDVLIVGAGPAGIAATLAAKKQKQTYLTIEQDSLGGTVAHFPRRKLVMTQPAELPLVGKVKFRETTKEKLLEFWQGVVRKVGLVISFEESLQELQPTSNGFVARTNKGAHEVKSVLLAIGRRGTPRKLEVPGEDMDKVVYRLTDPEQYRGQKVLVVGGGDSALEAACSIAEEPDTVVTLSYRSGAFSRAKQKNRLRVDSLVKTKRLQVLFSSTVKSIESEKVFIQLSKTVSCQLAQ